MRKTYHLDIEGRHPERLLEAAKHDIRKYLKRERRKPLPAGADIWDFDARFGQDEAGAQPLPLTELIRAIDQHVAAGAVQFYVELLRKPGNRNARPRGRDGAAAADDGRGSVRRRLRSPDGEGWLRRGACERCGTRRLDVSRLGPIVTPLLWFP